MSYAVIPVVEEVIFRGYYQRRLAEDWGDGPAILGTACFFTFAHGQYLIANTYNITMIASLFCLAIGLGVVFAWTRSLIPSMIAHAIINIPMTARWQGVLLVVFVFGSFLAWRPGVEVLKKVFKNTRFTACSLLMVAQTFYVVTAHQINGVTQVAIAMLIVALGLEAVDRLQNRSTSTVTVTETVGDP